MSKSMATGGVAAVPPAGRRVGRPRRVPAEATGLEPREEILQAAAALFVTKGYSATSTRLIAERVGLRQASLFHHFAKKEEILAELLDRTVRPALAFAERLERAASNPAAELFALAAFDVANLCSAEDNLAGLQLIHEARDERFVAFWDDRARLVAAYRRQVDALVGAARAALVTAMIFGLVESVLTWFGRGEVFEADAVAVAIARGALELAGLVGPPLDGAELAGRELLAEHRRATAAVR